MIIRVLKSMDILLWLVFASLIGLLILGVLI